MNKFYSILFGAALVASSSVATAQQLPNANFDGSWVDCVPWTSKDNAKTCGVQPDGWCISHVIGMNGTGATAVGEKAPSTGFDSKSFSCFPPPLFLGITATLNHLLLSSSLIV